MKKKIVIHGLLKTDGGKFDRFTIFSLMDNNSERNTKFVRRKGRLQVLKPKTASFLRKNLRFFSIYILY